MRIISGEAKGRPLFAPSGSQTRPTSDKIRGALFNIIGSRVLDSRVLDLFGGSGALALEALSRGAESAVIADNSRQAWQAIDRNAHNVLKDDFEYRVRILNQDYRSAIAAVEGQIFDLVFLDPPYRMAEAYGDRERWNRMSLHNISRSGIFAADRSIADYAETIWHVPYKK